jgi:acyl-CoA thioester hydrolase
MASEFHHRLRVEFADTDMAGIVHFSRYFRYMEVTEHAFLRSLGFSVADRASGIGWPRVDVQCRYLAPLRFEDEVEVQLRVAEKKAKAITYAFRLLRVSVGREQVEVAQGQLTVVCVTMDPETGTMKATPLPEALATQLEVAAP